MEREGNSFHGSGVERTSGLCAISHGSGGLAYRRQRHCDDGGFLQEKLCEAARNLFLLASAVSSLNLAQQRPNLLDVIVGQDCVGTRRASGC